jgi:hypothetical protein
MACLQSLCEGQGDSNGSFALTAQYEPLAKYMSSTWS